VIPGSADSVCCFLHVDDVVDFLKRATDEEYSSANSGGKIYRLQQRSPI